MADVQARREARRRKILQNSENRIKLITGERNGPINEINSNDNFDERRQYTENKHEEIDTRVENHIGNDIGCERNDFLHRSLAQSSSIESNTSKAFYISSKIYISILAFFMRLLFIFNLQGYVQNSIFLPFAIVKITLLCFQNDNVSTNSVLRTLLIFSNIPAAQSKVLVKILSNIYDIMRDFCLYFFIFVICHICLDFIV